MEKVATSFLNAQHRRWATWDVFQVYPEQRMKNNVDNMKFNIHVCRRRAAERNDAASLQ